MEIISVIFLLSGILGIALMLFIHTKKPSKSITPFILLLLVTSYYSITYGIELTLNDPELILLMIRIEYFGIVFIPPLWLIFVFNYTHRENELTLPVYAIFFLIPVVILIAINSGYLIPLLYQSVEFVSLGNLLLLSINPGILYLLNISYVLIASIAGLLILADFMPKRRGIVRNQVIIIIFGFLIPFVAHIAYIFIIGPTYHIDIFPLAFLSSLIIIMWALFRYRLFSLIPIAYSSVFHMIPAGVIVIDNYGSVIDANTAADEILNCNLQNDSGKVLSDYSANWPELERYIDGLLNEDATGREVDITFRHEDFQQIYSIQTTPLKDRHGHAEGLIIIIQDVTTSRNVEDALRRSEERLRNLFLQSPVAYQTLDKEGEISEINPEWSNMLGYNWKDVLNKSFACFLSERTRPRFRENFRAFLKEGSIYKEFELVHKNGQFITVMLSGRIQRDIEGHFVWAHCILHDITERKRMEDSLYQANKKLNLLSGITRHDILNQLTILKGYQELSKEHLADTGYSDLIFSKYLEKESAAAETINQQIKFTGDYQNIGIQSPRWQNVKTTFIHSIQSINPGNVKIITDVSGIEIYADPLLEKVFYNLVENALNYGEKLTKITLSFSKCDGFLILVLEDDGIGIPENEKENIFNRKYFRNTGLGMFLSRDILSITRIEIKETGIPSEGARFEITVPTGMYRV